MYLGFVDDVFLMDILYCPNRVFLSSILPQWGQRVRLLAVRHPVLVPNRG